VAPESKTIALKIYPDARLAAGAGGVAHYLADAAGLADEAASQLQMATIAACLEAFESLTPEHPMLDIRYAWYADRIEIVLAHKGAAAPAVGLDAIAGLVAPLTQKGAVSSIFAGVDRVQYDMRSGEAVTRLTKYIGHPAANR
jgi:hypothetical protein